MDSPARMALARGDIALLRQHAAAMARSGAHAAEGRFLLGMADAAEGRIAAGLGHLEAAIAAAPTAEYLAQQAKLLILLRRDRDAASAALAADALGPDDALTHDTLGNVQARLGDHAAAARNFAAASARDPGNMDYRFNLALSLGFLGRADEAAACHERILAAQPANGRVHYALAGLRKATVAHNNIARMTGVLARRPGPDDDLRIRYALAKEYEDLGDPAAARAHLDAANAAHRQRIGYDAATDAAMFDAIEAVFRSGEGSGVSTSREAPIFITGMPRTGTTLVDRILSSHGQVHSAGELQAMPLAIKLLTGTRTRTVTDPQTITASAALDPQAIAAAYLDRANQHRRSNEGRFIDKLPANFLYIGHIARALPAASIVTLRRNPMDTVWSNYKNLFATTSPYYAYSYDLIDIAHYFVRFDRLMRLWDGLLPGRVLQLGYEELVADQEQQSRRLFAHCGLEWTDAALDFHTNSAAVATPSAAQVRRPIYGDAVARWRAHEQALAPVAAIFAAASITI
ncbi:sulfotransferase [Sandarakinorhabdus sp.]|uniref:tetratricopeptide repeat-containing sulfotransferase family protein n=1 Tax=Sandarakinorhabdus sp. TaxID=1916663 RepID=UPI00333ED52C